QRLCLLYIIKVKRLTLRAFLISDTHLGAHQMSKDYWLYDVSKKYFDNFFIPYVKKHKRPGDVIFHLGDFFDNRNIIDVNVLHYGISLMKELAEILPVHIFFGNHTLNTEKSLD